MAAAEGSDPEKFGLIPTETKNLLTVQSHSQGQSSSGQNSSTAPPVSKVGEKISKNCKRFNRLFHADGEDSSSLDEPIEVTVAEENLPGTSFNNGSKNNASFDLEFKKESEILLEIEIEGDEDEIGSTLVPPTLIKSEDSPMSESMEEIENKPERSQIPVSFSERNDRLSPSALWNPSLFGKIKSENEEELVRDQINIKTEVDEEDDDEDEEEEEEDDDDEDEESDEKRPKSSTVRIKRERNSDFSVGERRSSRLGPKTFCNKEHEAQIMKRVKQILKKDLEDLTTEEQQILHEFPTLVGLVKKRLETRLLASERLKEFEDSVEVLDDKCNQLAEVLRKAQYVVVYTGAGISTSAQIPDYRGPNGIWTLLKNGQSLDSQDPVVLTTADPTVTHMTIKQLHQRGIAKHIVSQNCDGLHLRSGICKNALSEVHGNMYIEVCLKCLREYVRLFDVTEHTRRHEHRTGRLCYHCGHELKDTVVHFGERGSLRWPLNWAGAEYNVNKADVILCLGSSLKVLRRYPWLWGMDKPVNKRPKLFIVNLQWTPKDQYAALKIHGKCDEVMTKVMAKLNIPIPAYRRETDPIFAIATPLHPSEFPTRSSRELTFPDGIPFPEKQNDLNNYIRFEPVFRPSPGDATRSGGSDPTKKKGGKKREILKGNGNGWLGNAWGVKPKKRKLKS